MSSPPSKTGSIFRQAALDRLSSPEQLDQLMQVTTPRGWLALAALSVILLTALIWGFFGSIPTRVNGTGILIKTGGIAEIASLGSGMVTDVFVDVGDVVQQGQTIARVGQPELEEQILNARAHLEEMRIQAVQQETFIRKDTALQIERFARERTTMANSIAVVQERLKWLDERISNQEQLLERGLITRQALLATREQYNTAQQEIDQTQNRLKQIEEQELEARNKSEQALMATRFRVNDAERNLQALEDQRNLNMEVVSAHAGRIVEVMVNAGDLIQSGSPVVNIEVSDTGSSDELTAVVYIPVTEGKQITGGMLAQISPTTVKREEYGFLIGEVDYVSAFPATSQGMMRVLANDQLVRTLSASGAPIAVYARLQTDPKTPTGYAWSSGQGPAALLSSGTLCGVTIVVSEKRPISMVIPYVKKQLGMGSPEVKTGI